MTYPIKMRDCQMCHETVHDHGVTLTTEVLIDPENGAQYHNLGYTIRCCNCGVNVSDEYMDEVIRLWNGEARKDEDDEAEEAPVEKPETCLFSLQKNADWIGYIVCVTPKAFWLKHGHVSDQWHDCYDALKDFENIQESMFSTDINSRDEVVKALTDLGFEENAEFDAFVRKTSEDFA